MSQGGIIDTGLLDATGRGLQLGFHAASIQNQQERDYRNNQIMQARTLLMGEAQQLAAERAAAKNEHDHQMLDLRAQQLELQARKLDQIAGQSDADARLFGFNVGAGDEGQPDQVPMGPPVPMDQAAPDWHPPMLESGAMLGQDAQPVSTGHVATLSHLNVDPKLWAAASPGARAKLMQDALAQRKTEEARAQVARQRIAQVDAYANSGKKIRPEVLKAAYEAALSGVGEKQIGDILDTFIPDQFAQEIAQIPGPMPQTGMGPPPAAFTPEQQNRLVSEAEVVGRRPTFGEVKTALTPERPNYTAITQQADLLKSRMQASHEFYKQISDRKSGATDTEIQQAQFEYIAAKRTYDAFIEQAMGMAQPTDPTGAPTGAPPSAAKPKAKGPAYDETKRYGMNPDDFVGLRTLISKGAAEQEVFDAAGIMAMNRLPTADSRTQAEYALRLIEEAKAGKK